MHTDTEMYESLFPGYRDLDIALAHYWFMTWRGGEKVARAFLDLFPKADIYTLFYDKKVCGSHIAGHRVVSSRFDLPILRRHYQKLFPLYPKAVRSLHVDRSYDLMISSESGPIKGIGLPDAGMPHLCYIHTPMRYCWGETEVYLKSLPAVVRPLAGTLFERLRVYDMSTVDNVTDYVANSENVRKRVSRYYSRDARVVYPPIADELFKKKSYQRKRLGKHYLSFGALTPYKRIDILVDAFNESRQPLVIIGAGSESKRLSSRARDNITFLGSASWETIEEVVLDAKALLFPGVEDFGMIPLEVMTYGLPVLAYAEGGALETVVDIPDHPEYSTGCFFYEQSKNAVLDVIERFEAIEKNFDKEFIYMHAAKFREHEFKKRILSIIRMIVEK